MLTHLTVTVQLHCYWQSLTHCYTVAVITGIARKSGRDDPIVTILDSGNDRLAAATKHLAKKMRRFHCY